MGTERVPKSKARANIEAMTTLVEIETAANSLPLKEKEELLRFLAMQLRRERAESEVRIYSDDEVASMLSEDESDGARLRRNG